MSRFEHFLLGIGCGLILTSALVIADAARQYKPVEVRLPTDQRPIIPMCDREIFERIVEGCP